jgi:acetyltransferase-like isoleucine patch superfamily enzyme
MLANLVEYAAWCIRARTFASLGPDCYLRAAASIYNPGRIRLGSAVTAEPGLILEAFLAFQGQTFQPHISIGNRVSFGYHCHVGCIAEVTIGDDVLIASRVFISDHSHGTAQDTELSLSPARRPLVSKGPVRIGARVWIGEGVCILTGVTIGDNAIIGANSVVTRDVPPNTVYAGAPARLLKHLDQQSVRV